MRKLLLAFLLLPALAYSQAVRQVPNGTIMANFSGSTAGAQPVSAVQLPSGTSGSIFCWTSGTTLANSSVLTLNALLLGGGAGACPAPMSGSGLVLLTSGVASVLTFNPNATVSNTALGVNAAPSITGINDTAFGNLALGNATTGNSNTAFGAGASNYTSTANNTTAIGATALQGTGAAPTTGSNNTALGQGAGSSTQGAASNNTFLGANAGSSNTTGTFNVVVGNAVGSANMGTTSNTVVIGTNNSCIPSSTSATNEIDICAQSSRVLRVTGTNTPATSTAVFEGTVTAGGTGGYTIGTLPTCNAAHQGATAYVTNGQTTPTYLGAVSTTGAVIAPVFCNGTGWLYH